MLIILNFYRKFLMKSVFVTPSTVFILVYHVYPRSNQPSVTSAGSALSVMSFKELLKSKDRNISPIVLYSVNSRVVVQEDYQS